MPTKSMFLKGLKEDPSCGCLLVWIIIIVLGIGFRILSDSESTSSKNQNPSHGSLYRSGIYRPYETLPDIVDSVYICASRNSYAFHARHTCGALSNCRSNIRKISVEKACGLGRSPCMRCSRGVKFRDVSHGDDEER